MLKSVVMRLDRLGLRRLIARVANFAYRSHRFSVDADGDWIHEQAGTVIASPVPHTTSNDHVRAWVTDNWLWQYTPKEGDIIVDLGTGVGEEAVVISPLIGTTGLMIAVKAHPAVFRCLQKTVQLSGISNVRPIHCAAGGENGTIEIDDGPSFLTGSVFGQGIEVNMMTLDSLTSDLPRIDLFRTNIEGAERLMIPGMTESVRKIRHLCISCHDFLGKPAARSRDAVVEFLQANGFELRFRPETPAPMCDYVYGINSSPPSPPQN